MNQKRIPADRVKWENKLDKPKKWGKESYNLRQNYTCAECPKGGEPGPLGVKDGQLTPRVHIRETAPQERSPTWALHTWPQGVHMPWDTQARPRFGTPVLGYPSAQPVSWAGLLWGWCPGCPVYPPQALSPWCFCLTRESVLPGSVCSAPLLILLYLIKTAWCPPGVLLHGAAGVMLHGAAGRAVFHFFCVGGMT